MKETTTGMTKTGTDGSGNVLFTVLGGLRDQECVSWTPEEALAFAHDIRTLAELARMEKRPISPRADKGMAN